MGELINITGQFSDSQIPQPIARDTEYIAADKAHVDAEDPHPLYFNQSRADARYRRNTTTAFFQGGTQELGPYASCQSSASNMSAAYSSSQANSFTFGLHIQSFPWSGAAYLALHRPGSIITFFGLDSDNVLKWGGGNIFPVWRVWTEASGVPVWQAPSDGRLKKNIRSIKSALAIILEAKPISFQYRTALIEQWSESEYQRKKVHYGFDAEEFPLSDLVSQKDNGFLGLDYLEIVPFLVRAIQELYAELQDLKKSQVN